MGNTSSAPWGGQVSLLNVPLHCQSAFGPYDPINITVNSAISVTAPLAAGYNDNISFSDLTGQFILPERIAQDEGEYGYQYRATVFLVLSVGDIGGYEMAFQSSTLNDFSNDMVSFPADGEVEPPTGSFQMHQAESPYLSHLRLRSLSIIVQYRTSQGQDIDYPRSITCDEQQNPAYILASTFVSSIAGPVSAPANGYRVVFPPTPLGTKTTIANVPINCNQSGYSTFGTNNNYNFSISGTGPAKVEAGCRADLTNINSYFTVQGGIVEAMTRKFNSSYFLQLDIDQGLVGNALSGPGLGVSYANGTVVDMSREFSSSSSSMITPLYDLQQVSSTSDPYEFSLPRNGSLSKGFLVSGSNTEAGLNIVNLQGRLASYTIAGGESRSQPSRKVMDSAVELRCSAISPPHILGAPVV